jgi:hypothetical protein
MRRVKLILIATLGLSLILATGCGSASTGSDDEPNAGGGSAASGNMAAANGGGSADSNGTGSGTNGSTMSGGTSSMGSTPDDFTPIEPAAIACTGAVQHSAPDGMYSPASRISALDIPKTPTAAAEKGCQTLGRNGGTGLSGLLSFIGNLNEFVTEKDGDYQLLLLATMNDWAAGADADEHKLNIFVGTYKDSKFMIDLDSFNNATEAEGAKLQFDAKVDGCAVSTASGNFSLPLSVTDSLSIQLTLSSTTVRGKLSADGTGFGLTDGAISGYLSDTAVADIVKGLKAACDSDDPPSLCDTAKALLDKPEAEVVKTLLTLIKKYDTKLDADGNASVCNPRVEGDCNAVSVCLAIASEPATIAGVDTE